MNHTKHPTTNLMLGAPAGWDQSKLPCDALPVTRVLWDGVPAVVSYWVPTPEELAALNAGHAVQLSVVGQTMPPVALGVDVQPLPKPEGHVRSAERDMWTDPGPRGYER